MDRSINKEIVYFLYGVDKLTISSQLQNNNLNVLYLAELSNDFISSNESCSICLYYEKENLSNTKFVYWVTDSNINDVEKYLKLHKIRYHIVCEAKYYINGNCPSLANQRAIENKIKDNLLNYIENMFADSSIMNQYDLLISMDQNGWVPIEALENKLNDAITIKKPEIISCLEQSSILEIHESKNFLRRQDPILPYDEEKNRQVIVYDFLEKFKSLTDIVYKLDSSENAKINEFDKDSNSCVMTTATIDKATRLVQMSGENYTARFIVPRIKLDSSIAPTKPNDLNYLITAVNVLLMTKSKGVIETTRRFMPSELSHEFPEDFIPPNDELIYDIVRQTNYYFSDENILKDLFLLEHIRKSNDNWVMLNLIFGFKNIQKLTNDENVFIYAMCFSDTVQISRNAKLIRRRLPLPPWDFNSYNNTLFAYDFKDYLNRADELFFILFNELNLRVRCVRIVDVSRHVPHDLKRLLTIIKPWKEISGEVVAVIEFYDRKHIQDSIDNITRRFRESMGNINYQILEPLNENDLRKVKPPAKTTCLQLDKELRPPIYVQRSASNDDLPSFQSGSINDPAIAKKYAYNNKNKVKNIKLENKICLDHDNFPALEHIKIPGPYNTSHKNNLTRNNKYSEVFTKPNNNTENKNKSDSTTYSNALKPNVSNFSKKTIDQKVNINNKRIDASNRPRNKKHIKNPTNEIRDNKQNDKSENRDMNIGKDNKKELLNKQFENNAWNVQKKYKQKHQKNESIIQDDKINIMGVEKQNGTEIKNTFFSKTAKENETRNNNKFKKNLETKVTSNKNLYSGVIKQKTEKQSGNKANMNTYVIVDNAKLVPIINGDNISEELVNCTESNKENRVDEISTKDTKTLLMQVNIDALSNNKVEQENIEKQNDILKEVIINDETLTSSHIINTE